VVVGALFSGALVGAIRTSLTPDPFAGDLQWTAWQTLFGDPSFGAAVVFTIGVTVAATLVSALLAIPVAAALRDTAWARTFATLPVLVPHLLVAVVAVLWIGPGGLADRLIGGMPIEVVRARSGLGIVIVYVAKEVPFLALLLLAHWGDVLRDREEAAAVHGAGALARFRHMVVPGLRSPLAIGSLLVAAFVAGSFEVPMLVGPTHPDTIATYALRATRVADLQGQAIAAAALLVASGLVVAITVPAAWLVGRRRG